MSAPEPPAPRRARPSARAARQKERAAPSAAPPYLTRAIPPYELLSEEGLGQVERHADQLLEEIGLEIRGDLEAIRLWRAAGARISGDWRVHVPRGLAREIVRRSAPREFTQHARNPARQRADRRQPHGVWARLRPAVRVGPRRRAPLRHARGLPRDRAGQARPAAARQSALEGPARGVRAAATRCGPGGGPARLRGEAQTVDAGRARLKRPPRPRIVVKSICYLFEDWPLGCLPYPVTGATLMPAPREAVT